MEWLESLLNGSALVEVGVNVWNYFLSIAYTMLSMAPSQIGATGNSRGFSSLLSLSQNVFTLFQITAASIAAVMCMADFLKRSSDLKHGAALENTVSSLIKLILSEAVILNAWTIISKLLEAEQLLVRIVTGGSSESLMVELDSSGWDLGTGNILMGFVMMVLLIILSVGSGCLLLYTVFGVYLKLFLAICVGSLALASLPGPQGAQHTGFAWMKNLLCCVGEPAVMLLILRMLSMALGNGGFFTSMEADGVILSSEVKQMVQTVLIIVMTTGFVQGTDDMLRKNFGF